MSSLPHPPPRRGDASSTRRYHPFLLRNARYDVAGNIILLPEEPLIVRVPATKEDSSAASCPRTSIVRLPRALRDRIRAAEARHRGLRRALEAGQFAGHFVVVFLVLFVLLNMGSYWQIARARLLPNSDAAERSALQAVTHASPRTSGRKIAKSAVRRTGMLAVPRLPTAGMSLWKLTELLAVAPPDARLIIPKLAKNVPLVTVSDAALRRGDFKTFEKDIQDALRFGTVLYPGTARPGEIGNAFITGHSAYLFWDPGGYKEVFARLGTLEPGDEYAISYAGNFHHYRVTRTFEVAPTDTSVLDQPSDKRMSTLMTCSPVGTTLYRRIVQGEEFDPATGETLGVTEAEERQDIPQWNEELPV